MEFTKWMIKAMGKKKIIIKKKRAEEIINSIEKLTEQLEKNEEGIERLEKKLAALGKEVYDLAELTGENLRAFRND